MKRVLSLSIIAILLITCKERQDSHIISEVDTILSDTEIEKIVLDKEKDALNGWAEGSVLNYTKHFANDVFYVDDIAAHDGVKGIEAVKNYAKSIDSTGMLKKHKYELSNIKIQVLDKSAIIHLQYHPYSLEGDTLSKWKASVVYQQRNDDWKVIHANWSFYKKE